LPIIVTFSCIYTLQGSVATQLECGEIFTNHFIASCPESVPLKRCWKSVKIWQRYGQPQSETLFWDTVYKSCSLLQTHLWPVLAIRPCSNSHWC